MDSLAKTANNALIKYVTTLRRLGFISKSERKKLLFLWFLHRLKHDNKFLYFYESNENEEGWKLNEELEATINYVFKNSIGCLTDNVCTIKYYDGDCTPLPYWLWYLESEPDAFIELLVTNETDPIDTGGSKPTSFEEAMDQEYWLPNSFFMVENKDIDPETEDVVYLQPHQNKIE